MTPDQLAQRHPHLFHVTGVEAVPSVLERGLLCSADIVDQWEVPPEDRDALLSRRRPSPVPLSHPRFGRIVINDNAPLSEPKLARVLDDGLTPPEWLRMLNQRVFFFTDRKPLEALRGARLNEKRPKSVIVVDTRALAEAYGRQMEIAPINSGNTNYAAARRGLSTFAPLPQTDFSVWRTGRGRKNPDRIREVAVRGSVRDLARFVVDVQEGAAA
ncbi:DUF7002 family protein [Amaricoccus solimangrovi]|uniref:DUF7002 family protein n=1 Tax=Amaricoccus solimangrovi TaxID=2589815 RepID=UPI0015E46845|nr:hypothetical protein [Amaricoccus solimangrovi]